MSYDLFFFFLEFLHLALVTGQANFGIEVKLRLHKRVCTWSSLRIKEGV